MNPAAILFVVITTAPPLSPADAVRVLQSSHSISDRTGAYVLTVEDGPRAFVIIRSAPTAPPRPMPLYNQPITFRLPHKRGR